LEFCTTPGWHYAVAMRPDERAAVERAVQRITHQAAKTDGLVDDLMAAGLDGSNPTVVGAKMVRAELLSIKGDLERELEREFLDCVVCGVPAHYVGGLGVRAGHWSHAAPAPHATPKLMR
jgi:hypothetical protein